VSLGTRHGFGDEHAAFLRRLAAAVDGSGVTLVISAGPIFDVLRAEAWPDHVVLLRSADQPHWLGRARAIVTHAGLNTVKEALYFGVPMLALPINGDQLDNAYRVEYHGIGIRAGYDIASTDLRRAVGRLLDDDAMRQRAEAFQPVFRDPARNQVHVDAIEAALTG
jgi:UDP:flavonoid glycosyltransferase YjiC (YdhE family)